MDLTFFSSELRLRGDEPVVQPHHAGHGSDVLCFNGEIFDGIDIQLHENDGRKLYKMLQGCRTPDQVRDCIGSIEGPYAFVFYQHSTQNIFFARDPLGRRSLLIHRPTEQNPHFILTSVSAGYHSRYQLEELDTTALFCLALRRVGGSQSDQRNPLKLTSAFPSALRPISSPSRVNRALPDNSLLLSSLNTVPDFLSAAIDDLIRELDNSIRLQVQTIPQPRQDADKSSVAVLFSGGIDSTVLAFLAHRHIPLEEPIDLLNVAFENPRKIQGNVAGSNKRKKVKKDNDEQLSSDVSWLVPDRVSGLKETEELRRLCPGRRWNFIEINIPYQEYQEARETVESLMFPSQTVMDLSLAMALYFASRGKGIVRERPDAPPEPYTSPAKVLLNGLGSDELFGGYGRHRTAYTTGGWSAVINELQLELDRIPTRNLGRDDRVISSHGKETRHPFLSLTFLNFVAQLPVHYKMDPRAEPGVGDKMLLRLAARKLGLIEASSRRKRAMQFGSHSARMEGGESERRGDLLVTRVT
ncbi:hypothetical protein NEOLEDRAFT_1073160 [Neolentinus lepideus HHB14362 ss-1]|uniref:Glutamine amidotransferase type-2 domain-containing protein n=1 Tax=Neolentinus lepideus HHB14362 ss-1 TaxID=1314782 RepID=A0A165PYT9_9AGAM|nr:hypothetical protein NEOLEDRAFT_1073160 [Neolentinus lepideus HHB14362 ss-1]